MGVAEVEWELIMVWANRWTIQEFVQNPEGFLDAAKTKGPQLVIEEQARYTMTCEDLSEAADGMRFLEKGGPDGD